MSQPRIHTLQLPVIPEKSSLLSAFADQCGFPDYFGHNWDALHDCLGGWLGAQTLPLTLVLRGDERLWNASELWPVCTDILNSLMESWPGFSWQLQPATEADPA